MPYRSLICSVLLGVAATASPLAAETLHPNDAEVTVKVEPREILPYQAVRVTVTLTNAGKKQAGPWVPLSPNGHGLYLGMCTRPHKLFGSLHSAIPSFDHTRNPDPPHEAWDRKIQWAFEPAESVTWSAPLSEGDANTNKREGSSPWGLETLFRDPGEYVLRVRYFGNEEILKQPGTRRIEIDTVVTVREPKGEDDTKALALIQKHSSVANALVTATYWPHENTVSRLQQLIRDCPKSSYVPYARLAVARFHMRESLLGKPDKVTDDDRKIALAELKAILDGPADFPFRPGALTLMLHADPKSAKKTRADLIHDFGGSVEWIEAASRLPDMTPELWRDTVRCLPNSVITPREGKQ